MVGNGGELSYSEQTMPSESKKIVLIAHNLRSCHNVGSLLRTADGLGVDTVYLTGYTPHPLQKNDSRLPHIANKVHKQIQKTALGAESTVRWEQSDDVFDVIRQLKSDGFTVCAVEQDSSAEDMTTWKPPSKVALVVGRETKGIESNVLQACDIVLEIPMLGQKESFNVAQTSAMALYHCAFTNLV